MLRTAFVLLSGNIATSLLTLLRNLLVARLLPIADYGIAATFAIVMAVIEMASALGLQQQIVQAAEGNDQRFQAALQGFQAVRGALLSVVLLVLAGPFAWFLGVPEVTAEYRILAVVLLLNGFLHFDIYRMNRGMRFGPMVLSTSIPALLSLLSVWPLYWVFQDYRVMLWSIILQVALTVAISHGVAERRYRIAFDREVIRRAIRFGWPILINGALLFAVFNGDRVIVARELGIEILAIFSMGVTLTLAPTLVMERSGQNFLLPQLSRIDRGSGNGEARFSSLASATFQLHILFGAVMVMAVLVLGEPMIGLLLGDKFADLVPILTWLAIMQGLRVFKGGPSTVALSHGRTDNSMFANMARVAILPLAWLMAAWTGDLALIILIGIIGECVSLVVAFALVRWHVGVGLRTQLWPICASLAAFAAAGLTHWSAAVPVVSGGLFLLSLLGMTDLWRFARGRLLQAAD